MKSDRGEEPSLAVISPSEQKDGLTLPAIAAKADDLEAIRKVVEDAASVGGGLWLSYLFVLFYIAIGGRGDTCRFAARKSSQTAVPQCRIASKGLFLPRAFVVPHHSCLHAGAFGAAGRQGEAFSFPAARADQGSRRRAG